MMFTRSKIHHWLAKQFFCFFIFLFKGEGKERVRPCWLTRNIMCWLYRMIKKLHTTFSEPLSQSCFHCNRKNRRKKGRNNRAICQVRCLYYNRRPFQCSTSHRLSFLLYPTSEEREYQKVRLIIHSFNINTNAERPRTGLDWISNYYFPVAKKKKPQKKVDFILFSCNLKLWGLGHLPLNTTFFSFIIIFLLTSKKTQQFSVLCALYKMPVRKTTT